MSQLKNSFVSHKKDVELYQRIFGDMHRCKECKYFTKSIFAIQNHLKSHTSEVKTFSCEDAPEGYFCTECTFSTHLKAYFIQHIREYHGLKKEDEETKLVLEIYNCEECSLWTYSCLVLLKHQMNSKHILGTTKKKKKNVAYVLEDGVKWYLCHHCNHRTKYKHHLKKHILNKHTPSNLIQWFRCNYCNYKAKMKSFLKKHITVRHISPEHVKWHNCNQCEYRTNQVRYLKRHIYFKHTRYFAPKLYICDHCEYTNSKCSYLKAHKLKEHKTSEDYLQCDFCTYKTVYSHSLKNHIQTKHTPPEDIKWLVCEQCGYQAKTSGAMMNHKRNKHSEKKFNCNNCEYIASNKNNLAKHILRKHTADENINWFVCDQCEYKGKTKELLAVHRERHSLVTFQCDQCEYQSRTSRALKHHNGTKHTTKHSSKCIKHTIDKKVFNCDNCKYSSSNKANLKHHILRKHTADEDVNWFRCDQCQYKGKSKGDLTKHVVVHSLARNFHCHRCDFTFKRNHEFKVHLVKTHGTKPTS